MKDIFEVLMDVEKAKRKMHLMRGPEGIGDEKYCPVCKKPIHVGERGDMTCENFELRENYENTDKCFWHRWHDGTNYWSEPMEIFEAFAKESPEFKEVLEKAKRGEL